MVTGAQIIAMILSVASICISVYSLILSFLSERELLGYIEESREVAEEFNDGILNILKSQQVARNSQDRAVAEQEPTSVNGPGAHHLPHI